MCLNLCQIDSLVEKLLINAENLIDEARILQAAKAFARAHCLGHIAREETSKSIIARAAGYRIVIGQPVDWKMTMRRLRSHESKLLQETINSAVFAAEHGHDDQSYKLVANIGSVVKNRNSQKNSSLYVEIDSGCAQLPAEAFTEFQSARTIALAEIFLRDQRSMIDTAGPLAAIREVNHLENSIEDLLKPYSDQLPLLVQTLGEIQRMIKNEVQHRPPPSAETPHPPTSASASPAE